MRTKMICFCIVFLSFFRLAAAQGSEATVELVLPSATNPAIHEYDDANVVISGPAGDHAPVVLFLSGTHGRPQHSLPLLKVVAGQGYRVIGLTYNDEPSVSKVCPKDPDPACARAFRAVRTFGESKGPVSNPQYEAIVPRLIALLQYLNKVHPDAGWNTYLASDGQPVWSSFIVSGHSQGAGMAALLAKRYLVARVVLFSSPWDTTGFDQHPAPWLREHSATPMDRWWAERHARENTTALIANAYAALGIPARQVLVFDKAPERGAKTSGDNPFHATTTHDERYTEEWCQMYGRPAH